MSAKAVGWQTVENRSKRSITNDLPQTDARPVSNIRRRTKLVNRELKKYSRVISYARYVEIKTKILRCVSEDESTEDSESDRELSYKKKTDQNDVDTECTDSSEEEITSEMCSRDKRNSTSVLDQTERVNVETEVAAKAASSESIPESAGIPTGDSGIDQSSPEQSDDATVDGCLTSAPSHVFTTSNPMVIEKEAEEREEMQEQIIQEKIDNAQPKKSYPIITHTEIVGSKYTIIRDKNACTADESMNLEEKMSSESQQVAQLEPKSSVCEENESILSDSSRDEFASNHDDNSPTAEVPEQCNGKTRWTSKENLQRESSAINSIKDQMEKQDIRHSSQAQQVKQRASTRIPFEAESLRHVLTKLSKEQCRNEGAERVLCADEAEPCDTPKIASREEYLPRPSELREFVASRGLIPECELSTITMKDISTNSQDDEKDDMDIWLMEIPRSVITDPELCGKRMVIDRWNLTIGDTTYDTIPRHDQSLTCVLRSKKKEARYKTVNIRPVCSIKVGHQPAPEPTSLAIAESPVSPKSVPFPKNVRPRNPLMDEDEAEIPPLKKIRTTVEERDRKQRKKTSSRRKSGLWTINRFIMKSKEKS